MKQPSFLARKTHGVPNYLLLAMGLAFAVAWIPRGVREAIKSNNNNAKDWLPPTYSESTDLKWFHQHFSTGQEVTRHLAIRGGGLGIGLPTIKKPEPSSMVSLRDGGLMIEYEDEDPEIRRMFEEELRKNNVECTMAPVVYRTEPFKFSF